MAHDSNNNSYKSPTSSFPQYDPSLYTDSRAYRAPSPPQPPMNANPKSPIHPTTRPTQPRSTDQPITDAVNNAFDHSQAAHQLPPNLIAKVTEEVIARLRAEMAANPPQQQAAQPTNPARPNAPVPPAASFPNAAPYAAAAPQSPPRKTYKSASVSDSADEWSEGEAVRHAHASSAPRDIPMKPKVSPPSNSNGGKVGDKPRQGINTERPSTERYMTSEGETIVEKMWKPLFNNGVPTERLSQFLRGVALYLVSVRYKMRIIKTNKRRSRSLSQKIPWLLGHGK
jgi:hypothetical protein